MAAREDFSKNLSEKTGMSYAEAYSFVGFVLESIEQYILDAKEIEFSQIGILCLRKKKARYNGVYKIYSKDHFVPFLRPAPKILKKLAALNPADYDITKLGFIRYRNKNRKEYKNYFKYPNAKKEAQTDPHSGAE